MNKRAVAELARRQQGAKNGGTSPSNGAECPVNQRRNGDVVGPDLAATEMVARLYVALIGGAEWNRTQATELQICRESLRRARLAARIFAAEGGNA